MEKEYFNIRYELDPETARKRIGQRCHQGGGAYVVVADGNVLAQVHEHKAYRQVVDSALFSICDSSWVPLYLKLIYGIRPPQYCGSSIFEDLIRSRTYRMMFIGSSDKVLGALKERLVQIDPRISAMEFRSLEYADVDDFDYEAISKAVNAASPDIIWLSLGAPKQEMFASRLAPLLQRGVVIPVGAVFDFYSGVSVDRAPAWMVRLHLEFLYRIFSQPRKQLQRVGRILRTLPAVISEECRKKAKTNGTAD